MKYFLKKNLIGIIAMLVCIIIPIAYFLFVSNSYGISPSDCKTTQNDVEVWISEDGSMKITEKMQLTTRWYEINKDIVYSADDDNKIADNVSENGTKQQQKPSFDEDVVSVRVLDHNGKEVMSTGNNNYGDDYRRGDLISYSFKDGKTHTWEDDPSHIVASDYDNAERIYIYRASGLGPNCTIEYTYGYKGAVMYYSDIAEINAKFVSSNEMSTKNVTCTIHLPSTLKNDLKSEDVYVYGHGTDGKVTYPRVVNQETGETDPYTVILTSEELKKNEEIEARIMMPNTMFDKSLFTNEYCNVSKVAHLENAIKYEEVTIPNETRMANIVNVVSIIIFVSSIGFAIFTFIHLYNKYDKEYTPEFFNEYYRELPNDYGPAVMGYLYRFKDPDKNDVTATLLDLIRRKYIILDNNGASLLDDKPNYKMTLNSEMSTSDLMPHEQELINWFFNIVGNGQELSLDELDNFNKKEKNAIEYQNCNKRFNESIKRSAESYDFFEANVATKKTGLFNIVMVVVILIQFFINATFTLVIPGFSIWFTIGFIIFINVYARSIIRRSKKANEEFTKWKAFKKFLEEFSNMKDYPMPGIIVWEHYMVYATEFGIADKVEKQVRFKYSSLGMENELTSSNATFFFYPSFYNYYSYRMANSFTVASTTIAKAQAARAGGSGGGRGGFGGGSSHGMGGTHMSGR